MSEKRNRKKEVEVEERRRGGGGRRALVDAKSVDGPRRIVVNKSVSGKIR